jgi:hypothetical protein
MQGNGNGNPTRKDGGLGEIPATTLQLVITWDQMTGAINVTGPILNSVVAYGMMEAAKVVIQKHIDQQATKSILEAKQMPTLVKM